MLAEGNYGTDSELIRDALREKQMRVYEIEMLRAKLIRAEKSGLSQRTPEEVRDEVKARFKKHD